MTVPWPEIWFIRHGQTDWNAEGRYQGSRDIPLNDIGRAQADANGDLLRMLLARDGAGPSEFGWFASPLGRATETMARVRAAFEPPPPPAILDARLIEISFGTLEGKLHQELVGHPMIAPGRRDEAFWHYRPTGGENYDDLTQRLESFRPALQGPAVIVAHGGVLRVLRHLIEGASRADVVNWSTPQDIVYHFADRRMTAYPAGTAWID